MHCELSERHLHLSVYLREIAFAKQLTMGRAEGAVGVLQLQAALRVKPQLNASHEIGLKIILTCVIVEIVNHSYDVKLLVNGNG